MQKLCGTIIKLLGWKMRGAVPALDKFVICVAPHTSNLDFVIGKLFYSSLGLKVSFLIKKEWLRPPFGHFMRNRGAIGVDRNKHEAMTDRLANLFHVKEHLHLAITPEGTRRRNPNWKLGFYYIAKKAGVPIVLVALDYKYKEIQILETFHPTDDAEADIAHIKGMYKDVTACHPKLFAI